MYKDERGIIEDFIVGDDYAVTHITFNKGAIRGCHYHKETLQIDTVLYGEITDGKKTYKQGDVIRIEAGTPHGYKALKDSAITSQCFGKRIGDNYSKDTFSYDIAL